MAVLFLQNNEEIAVKINKAIFPGIQGGPLMHTIAAKAVCFKEALDPSFKTYAEQVVKNASVLADTLMAEGFKLVSGGTDNHLMLVNLTDTGVTGKEAEKMLDEVGITVNKNAIPFDTKSPFVTSGIRIGTPASTSRGFKEEDMVEVGKLIAMTIKDFENNKEEVKTRVKALCDNTHFTDKPIEPVTKISTAPKDYYADFDIFSKSAIFLLTNIN